MNGNLKPFKRGYIPLDKYEKWAASTKLHTPKTTETELRYHYNKLLTDEVWVNNEYQVAIDKTPPHGFPGATMWHLSIKRRDKRAIHDWRDLQAIKNMLVAPEAEAVEIYPSAARVVDTANQYHLWVFIVTDGIQYPMVPIGWTNGMVSGTARAEETGSKQRELAEPTA